MRDGKKKTMELNFGASFTVVIPPTTIYLDISSRKGCAHIGSGQRNGYGEGTGANFKGWGSGWGKGSGSCSPQGGIF